MYIIVDKSWITSVNKSYLQEICNNNFLVLPAPLGYELFTSDNKKQTLGILKKLNTVKEKIFLIEVINELIRFEIEHQKPFGSIERFFQNIYFDANIEKIKNGLTRKQRFMLNYHKINWEGDGTKSFLTIMEGVHNEFPQLKNVKDSKDKIFDEVLEIICYDKDLLMKIYDSIRPSKYPPSKIINYNWAVLRWLQIHLLYAVEYKRRYDLQNRKISLIKLAHDNIDIEYLMLGVLNKCMASDDNKIKRLFNLCCKDGILYSVRETV